MKIYTSYFAKINDLPKDVVPIAICGKEPDWYHGLCYKKLAPKFIFFQKWKETKDNDYYTKCFYELVLAHLTPDCVYAELEVISQGKDVCLLCYEEPEEFCHRHIVADWLSKNGITVEEYKDEVGIIC